MLNLGHIDFSCGGCEHFDKENLWCKFFEIVITDKELEDTNCIGWVNEELSG